MAYNYPNPCGPCYPYIPQCYPCPPPFPPCIREGPTGPAGTQGSTGPTGCTGPPGIKTAFSTERFTVMLDSDPTLNNIVMEHYLLSLRSMVNIKLLLQVIQQPLIQYQLNM